MRPSLVVTMRTMDLFHSLQLKCPQLSLLPFVRMLCDLNNIAYRPYYREQFSICYDVYVSIRNYMDVSVLKVLGRDTEDWRALNACPSCTFELKGERPLERRRLWTFDGNNSMRRNIRRTTNLGPDDVVGAVNEREDLRDAGLDYALPREKVNEFARETVGQKEVTDDEGMAHGCSSRWKNMDQGGTSKMWGVFDETGIFVALCRHQFVYTFADMVKSGEQAKYPLAVVEFMLRLHGPQQASGYDVGCNLTKIIQNSSLAERVDRLDYQSIEGLLYGRNATVFHGHAHNRLCQLSFLPLYLSSMGLEDFEGCERFFNVTNGMARGTRNASWMKHHDRIDNYERLSMFLCNNYRQAIGILQTKPLHKAEMARLGIFSSSVFDGWLKDEREYLESLKEKIATTQEKLEVEYLEKLDRLHMVAEDRWAIGSAKWNEVEKRMREQTYRRSLDQLEALIVSRIFELTKMNLSGTGYKLRRHIASALQNRSKAVRKALERFNHAAKELGRKTLVWDEVVEYSFLSDFDLLRDTDSNVLERPWSTHSARQVLDNDFKLRGAASEIQRLNIEISRHIAYMQVEDDYLQRSVVRTAGGNPHLANQIDLYRLQRSRTAEDPRAAKLGLKLTGGVPLHRDRFGLVLAQSEAEPDEEAMGSDAEWVAAEGEDDIGTGGPADSDSDLEEEFEEVEDEEDMALDALALVLEDRL
ncbi:hypothetical protein BDZ89DRAFT_1094016 [Hymenopellis radicata]|nr:hypothetical protein BDZ89DRAFT_1094016 [Hymenopellis radicata]